MRGYEMVRRRGARVVIVVTLAVIGVLPAFAAPASARSPKPPAREVGHPRVTWSASKIEQGIGEVQLAHGRHMKDQLDEVVDLGPASFHNDDIFGHEGRAVDVVHSENPDGTPIDDAEYLLEAQAPTLAHRIPFPTTGGDAHLDWTQAYDRRRRDASLGFQITRSLRLDIIDENGPVVGAECPALTACDSIHALIRYHLRAWVVAGGMSSSTSAAVSSSTGTRARGCWARPPRSTRGSRSGPMRCSTSTRITKTTARGRISS